MQTWHADNFSIVGSGQPHALDQLDTVTQPCLVTGMFGSIGVIVAGTSTEKHKENSEDMLKWNAGCCCSQQNRGCGTMFHLSLPRAQDQKKLQQIKLNKWMQWKWYKEPGKNWKCARWEKEWRHEWMRLKKGHEGSHPISVQETRESKNICLK